MLGDDIPANGIAIKINKNDSNFLFIPEKISLQHHRDGYFFDLNKQKAWCRKLILVEQVVGNLIA